MPKSKLIFFSIGLVIVLVGFILGFKVDGNQNSDFCLNEISDTYNNVFLSKDGRVIDFDRKGVTTSEGQSYILLKSVIMDDKQTFNLAYGWAKNNLQRKDKLFGWLWGETPDGTYKIIDDNSASDADVDIAFALLLAHEKWGDYRYLQEATEIMHSIWDNEVVSVGTQLVLMPGINQAQDKTKIEVNPSYFAVYEFKFFQKYDDLHDWNRLIDSSYYYIDKSMKSTKTGLPPDWFLIKDGQVVLENPPKSNFSYDAIRVFARAYLDYLRTGDKRNLAILDKSQFFISRWEKTGHFYTNYQPDGKLADNVEFPGSIAVLVPIISIYNPKIAEEIYQQKIQPYLGNKDYWEAYKGYYAKNLIWFGCYLYDKDTQISRQMAKFGKEFKTKHGK